MSIEKFKTKNGETRWRVRSYVDGRGSKQIKKVFRTRNEAQDFEHSFTDEKKSQKTYGSNPQTLEGTTFKNEAEYWLSIRGSEFSPGHRKRALGILKELLPLMGHIDPKFLHSEALYNLRQKLSHRSGRYGKIKPASINRMLEVVTAVLNFSAKTRRIPFYPAAGFRKLAESREDIEFWERGDAETFLNYTNSKYPPDSPKRWIHVVYFLGLNTALRAGEIWGLQAGDLKHGSQVLHIQRQWDRVELAFRLPKGKSPRFVPCNEGLQEELEALIQQKRIKPGQTIFQNENGNPICHDNFSDRTILKDIEEAQVPRITFHGLRHTATTLMIASGIDLKTVQEICGHKNIATTMNYAHLLAESVKNVSKQFSISPRILLTQNNSNQ